MAPNASALHRTRSAWLWPLQIAVGCVCIALSVIIVLSPQLGGYTFLLFAGAGLIILGIERIAAGVRSRDVKRSSRIINVALGTGIIAWIGSGFLFPEIAINYFVLFLGLGLLANGGIRLYNGLKKREHDSTNILTIGAGIVSTATALLIFAIPSIGLLLLLIMTALALAVCGGQVIIAGIRGRHPVIHTAHQSSSNAPKMVQQFHTSDGIWKSGSWFRDSEGRYLLFRGVNFASRSKLPPYLPIVSLHVSDISQVDLRSEIESAKHELDLLQELGFNVVRLLISWKAIEPYPNLDLDKLLPDGEAYLKKVSQIIDTLYARHIYVILDFHQDIAHEVYGGDGFPDWTLAIDNGHSKPEPSNLRNKKWQINYSINKSVKNTLNSFWKNSLDNFEWHLEHFPVKTHFERTIGQVAKFFSSANNGEGHPAILGIEPFNEPHPVGIQKKYFEEHMLTEYYRNVNSEMLRSSAKLFMFLEPRVDWTISIGANEEGSMTGSTPFSAKDTFHMDLIKNLMLEQRIDSKKVQTYLPPDLSSISTFAENGILSFHFYDAVAVASSFLNLPESMYTYKREWPAVFDQMVNAATSRSLIPFLTEFGGFQGAEQIREYLNLQFEQIERHLLNATYWNYDLYHTEEGKDNWNLEDYSLLGPNKNPRNLDVVARPYPLRSSAQPSLLFFDIESKIAMICLTGPVVSAPTIIYIPARFHYEKGFAVWATGVEVEWDSRLQLLYWTPSKELENNELIISTSRELDVTALPEKSRGIPVQMKFMGSY